MWLEARTRAAITSWEKIILDEIFVFCGGQEGSWSNDDGWTDNGDGSNGAAASSSSSTHSKIDQFLQLGLTDPGRGCHLEQRRAGVVMSDGRVRFHHIERGCSAMLCSQNSSANYSRTMVSDAHLESE